MADRSDEGYELLVTVWTMAADSVLGLVTSYSATMVLRLCMIQSYMMDNSVIRVFSSQVTSAEKQDFITYSVYFSLVTVMSILSTFSDKGALTQIGMADQIQENIREDEYVDIHNKVITLEDKILNVRKVL